MKWLFLYFVIDTSVGGAQPRTLIRTVFPTQASCDAFGESYKAEFSDNSLHAFSVCLPASVFADTGLKSEKIGR